MFTINFNENKDNFFRLNITKDPTIEFSKDIEFYETSQNKNQQKYIIFSRKN